MTNLERVAYIRGLAEGLELDTDKKEVKVLDIEPVNWLKKGMLFINSKFRGKKYEKSL